VPAIPLPDPELSDGVVRLRPPRPEDAPALIEACRDPLIQRFTFVPAPYEPQHAHGWIAEAPARRAAGEALNLVIASDQDDTALLGTAGLLRPVWEHRVVEIGYFVAPQARGHGYATRAIKLLAPWAIETAGFARVTADIDVDNTGSRRVAERAGFTREGVLRSAIEAKGRRWTLVVHSLITEDLQTTA
jgi:RimJ/RimL family protein N-acetyltransferase